MIIYHMLPADTWYQQAPDLHYEGDTLATEGFIHCTDDRDLLLQVANRMYVGEEGRFVILCIGDERVEAAVRWEEADDHTFPHIYGPLNLDAVLDVISFPRDQDGTFLMPPEWRE